MEKEEIWDGWGVLTEEAGVCVAEYKVEPKRTPAAEPLPAPFFLRWSPRSA